MRSMPKHRHCCGAEGGGFSLFVSRTTAKGSRPKMFPWPFSVTRRARSERKGPLFLQTLVFRGEALRALLLSQTDSQDRVAHALSGIRAVCEGGELKQMGEMGLPVGTEVEVQDLFYNIPVKRKFMKSIRSELHHVLNHFLKFGLAYPTLSFKLVHDGRVLQDLLKTKSPLARMEAILGGEIYQHLQPLEWEAGDIRISGFASDPSVLRTNGEGITLFVNQRIIKDRVIHKAVMEGYHRVIPTGNSRWLFCLSPFPLLPWM